MDSHLPQTPRPLPCPTLPPILIGFQSMDFLIYCFKFFALDLWFCLPYNVDCWWSVCKSYWCLFPLWFNCLVQHVLIVCWAELFFGALVFWWTCDISGIRYQPFTWIQYFYSSNSYLMFRVVSVFSTRSWTYQKLLRITWLLVIGRVCLVVVWFFLVNAWTVLFLIMLKYRSNSTVSCANTFFE